MLELTVCIGSSCHIKGAYNVIQTFQQIIEERSLHGRIAFKSSFCQKQCQNPGVAVSVNGVIHQVTAESSGEFFVREVSAKLLSGPLQE
ncbi:MAG: (2Fe-2S) ferredoxin domain-containing protein [Treponema sp.]|jgi:NADH:ubiquinone oxidoreductase subunit E|nr:(2Fe-2S) ferredoxin domain-containing protein [Treponema sp.]